MDAVKEYWSDKTFLLGMFLCIIGTLLGAVGVVTSAVLIELTGIILMIVIIYKIENKITYKLKILRYILKIYPKVTLI